MKRRFVFLFSLFGILIFLSGCRFIVKIDSVKSKQTLEQKSLTKERCIEKSIEEIKKIPEISELIKLYDQTISSELNPSTLIDYYFELSNEQEDSFTIALIEDHQDHAVRIEHIRVNKADGSLCLEDVVSAECLPQEADSAYLANFIQECGKSF